jgi:predicted AlkP superfamily pyrophosphatase or phosphodiesterase
VKQKLIVFSADAMVYEDLAYFKTLPNYKKYLAGGAEIKRMKTIYPTVTYPAHVSIATGNYPDRHGVVSNLEFHPGMKPEPGMLTLPWHWFHHVVKGADIFDAAKKAGLSTAGVNWPVTGRHPSIDFLMAEYWTQGADDSLDAAFARAGSCEGVLNIIDKYKEGMIQRQHPGCDIFKINCCCDIIRQYKPDLLMIHIANIDDYRHKYGIFNDHVTRGVEETDRWLGRIMEAAESAGIREKTNLVLISDHGQIDISRIININVLFADYGLIQLNKQGELIDWDAYSLSNGASALVFLKDPNDPRLYGKTYGLLRYFCEEGIYGIGGVFTEPEARRKEHFGGNFSFVVETDGYSAFGDNWNRPLVKSFDTSDYRYGQATHGYLPDKGPQPIFLAKGPGIKNGITLENRNIVDEAPTFARLLGISLPDTDGVCIDEILAASGSSCAADC